MPLQALFGDDEHTAQIGPYRRLLKARKWLYITTVCAVLVDLDYYNAPATSNLIRVFELPRYLIAQFLVGGLAYLCVQYSALLVQFLTTSDIIFRERFDLKRADALREARVAVNETRQNVERDRARLSPTVEDLKDPLPEEAGSSDEAKLSWLTEHRVSEYMKSTERRGFAEGHLASLTKQEPTMRPFYKAAEAFIDALRLAPPLLLGGWLLVRLIPDAVPFAK